MWGLRFETILEKIRLDEAGEAEEIDVSIADKSHVTSYRRIN